MERQPLLLTEPRPSLSGRLSRKHGAALLFWTVRFLRISVASLLTLAFTGWSVDLFRSQPSGKVPTIQIPKCAAGDTACLEHALKVAFSTPGDGHWSLWVVWVFWAVVAAIWLAACILILVPEQRSSKTRA